MWTVNKVVYVAMTMIISMAMTDMMKITTIQ